MAAKIATEKLCFPHFCPVKALSAHIKVRVKIRSGDRRSLFAIEPVYSCYAASFFFFFTITIVPTAMTAAAATAV